MRIYKEENRPAMYRAMKYWGKKPHNIWSQLILENTKEGSIVLDPFVGSGVSFIEAIKLNRYPIGIDINPMSTFLIDTYSQDYILDYIKLKANNIINRIKRNDIYMKNYVKKCNICNMNTHIYNYIWKDNKIIGINYKCDKCGKIVKEDDYNNYFYQEYPLWEPEYNLENLSSINTNTITKFGGNEFKNFWTSRNFEILKIIFDELLKVNEPYKKVFVLAFLQTLHLTTKMCAVRSNSANRPLSTSWGRPAYMALSKYMEQNPLIQFYRAVFGRTGVIKALESKNKHVGSYTISKDINIVSKNDGIMINDDFISHNLDSINGKVDFVITDPPYGGIIQYNELSLIWNLWLIKAYPEYCINLEDEIIINSNLNESTYEERFGLFLNKVEALLVDRGKAIITFNSNNDRDWEILEKQLLKTKLHVEDIYVQVNKRASEANVKAKKGMAISDYYILLKKDTSIKSSNKESLVKIKEIINDIKKEEKIE